MRAASQRVCHSSVPSLGGRRHAARAWTTRLAQAGRNACVSGGPGAPRIRRPGSRRRAIDPATGSETRRGPERRHRRPLVGEKALHDRYLVLGSAAELEVGVQERVAPPLAHDTTDDDGAALQECEPFRVETTSASTSSVGICGGAGAVTTGRPPIHSAVVAAASTPGMATSGGITLFSGRRGSFPASLAPRYGSSSQV